MFAASTYEEIVEYERQIENSEIVVFYLSDQQTRVQLILSKNSNTSIIILTSIAPSLPLATPRTLRSNLKSPIRKLQK